MRKVTVNLVDKNNLVNPFIEAVAEVEEYCLTKFKDIHSTTSEDVPYYLNEEGDRQEYSLTSISFLVENYEVPDKISKKLNHFIKGIIESHGVEVYVTVSESTTSKVQIEKE